MTIWPECEIEAICHPATPIWRQTSKSNGIQTHAGHPRKTRGIDTSRLECVLLRRTQLNSLFMQCKNIFYIFFTNLPLKLLQLALTTVMFLELK